MSKEYIGKACPYCKTPLVEGDTVVFCSVCDMPHHLSCWQENQGCTTFGCTGSIKEIIGNDSGAAATPVAPQPTPALVAAPKPVEAAPAKPAPAPTQVEQTEQPIETLYESKEMVFMSDLPIVLENTAIIIDRTKDKLFARCTFRSVTDKAIKAVLIEVSCQDVWGSALGEPIVFQYLDLKTKRESKFGQTSAIDLPDKTTRKIRVSVKKILVEDDTVVSGGSTAFTMSAPVLLSKYLSSDELVAEYARETTAKAQFVPEDGSHYWFCTCGALNESTEEKCHNCDCTKEQLTTALNPDTLQANMITFAAEKKAAAEKAQAEQAERIRQAEEQVRLEQEQKEREIKLAESVDKSKKRPKKTVRAIIISVIVIVALGCGAIFFSMPYFIYRAACDALDNGEYDVAIQMFEDLGDYRDSEDRVLEAKYLEADKCRANKNYKIAYQLFAELGSYKESEEKILATILLWEAEVLESSSTTDASIFSETVNLVPSQYKRFYNIILRNLIAHDNVAYWYRLKGTAASGNMRTILEMLPYSYEDTATLRQLFDLLVTNWRGCGRLFRDYESLMRQCWSYAFVRDLAEEDDSIAYFLEGDWSTYGENYYFNFYENDNGGVSCSYNLPLGSKPYGTKYYDIENMIYYWDDDSSNHLARVCHFEIVDYDTIIVFCYENGRTYTLYR